MKRKNSKEGESPDKCLLQVSAL
uniref:Uncharacterized protein n=1 Tax=Anguilla anguilla TaxID=7936 RepID=A0A0E9U230_ANGAN